MHRKGSYMKVKLVLLISGMLLSTGFLQAQDEIPSELSNTRVAYVTLKIITDPKVFPLQEDLGTIRECFDAQRLYDANKGYAAEDNSWFNDLHVMEAPREIGGAQVCRIQWSISLGRDDKPAAEELAENLVDGLRDYLYEVYSQNINIFREKAQTYARRVSDAEQRLRQLMDERNTLAQDALDEPSFRQRAQERQRALMENQMQRSVLNRRADRLAKNIKQLKVVSAGGILGDAEAERERQRRLDDEIARLDREHRDTLIELEEQDVRISDLNGLSPGSISTQYELLTVQIEAAKESLKRALIEKEDFATQMQLIQKPVVIDEIRAIMPANEAVSQAK